MKLINKEDMSFICCFIMFYILLYVLLYIKINLYEKIWCICCMCAQFLFIVKYISNTKSQFINFIVDETLYYSMVLSIFIINPILLQIQIFTLITILLLRIIYKECILTKSKWKTSTKIGYVTLFIFTILKYKYIKNI